VVRAILQGEKICHFHLFHGALGELTLVLLAKICRRKVIITVHDIESFGDPAALNCGAVGRVYRLADHLIVHNEVSKRELIGRLRISAAKISIIPHGGYLEAVGKIPTPTEARRALGIGESKKVLLFFGHIKDVKGLDLLLEALPQVVREVPDVLLLVAGRPWKSDFSRYEALIDKLGIRSRCVLHIRFIPDDDVAYYYAAADVVVLPYRRIYQSGVVLMAMSYKRPVVVSDLPGMTEIITDEENGYVFPEGSKHALSMRLIRALQDEQGRERVVDRALQYVRANHDWGKIGKRTTELYHAVVS
jgi:glycosyltransferase involved in cell wall biosynthesis